MRAPRLPKDVRSISAAGVGTAVGLALGYLGRTWYGYGRPRLEPGADPLLDRFMPACDVRERHSVQVDAPLAATYAAALALDLERSPLVRAIFRGRELLMGGEPAKATQARALLSRTLALGWGVLAEDPGREIVVGAVTRPWEPDPRFRSVPPDEFAAFAEPHYVKIAWTLAAHPLGPTTSLAVTETRAVATDEYARRRFRLYWTFLSPGIRLIRREGLRLVKRDAEGRCRQNSAMLEGTGVAAGG
jgi:hypothetical protein